MTSSHLQRDILITGASGVIAGAIARQLARPGVALHLTSRRQQRLASLESELQERGAAVYLYTADLAIPSQAATLVDHFWRRAANPAGLICAAGTLGETGPFWNNSLERWRKTLQENFLSHAAIVHGFVKKFAARKRHQGAILVFSGAGLGGNATFSRVTGYSTAKAALTHLVEALAPDLQPLGLTINAIAPGMVRSGITDQAVKAGEKRIGAYATDARKCVETGGVSPELTAQLVKFLMSPAARGITGRFLSARFDQGRLKTHASKIKNNPNLFRMRRIDDVLFGTRS